MFLKLTASYKFLAKLLFWIKLIGSYQLLKKQIISKVIQHKTFANYIIALEIILSVK